MNNGWQYVQSNGTTEKIAPKTLMDYVYTNEEDGVSLASNMPANPNLLINGEFQVWQRGEDLPGLSGGQYFADRWKMNCYGTVHAARTAIEGRNAVQFDIGTDKVWCGISQSIEDKANYHSGRTVCVTIYSPNPDTIQSAIIETSSGNSLLENAVWSADSITGTITIAPFTSGLMNLWIYFDVSKQFPSIYAVKMEEGRIATPLSPRTYAEELAMCQRYYETNLGNAYPQHLGSAIGTPTTGILAAGLMWKVKKRAVPAVKIFDTLASTPNTCTRDNTGTMDYTGQSAITYGITPDGCLVLSLNGASATSIKCYYAADAETY